MRRFWMNLRYWLGDYRVLAALAVLGAAAAFIAAVTAGQILWRGRKNRRYGRRRGKRELIR